MFAREHYVCPRLGQHESNEETQFSVTEDEDLVGRLHMHLLGYFEGSSQRFGEDCLFVGHTVRHLPKVLERKRHILGKNTILVGDAEGRPLGAVLLRTPYTELTGSASQVYLSHNPFAGKIRVPAIGLFDYTDEFMAGHTLEPLVTLHDLHVGPADSCHKDPDEGFVLPADRCPIVIDEMEHEAVKEKSFHFN